MNALTIGSSALSAGQQYLNLIGQNIANATTPGYHRQQINLTSKTTDGVNPGGVDVASITRYTADPVDTAILQANSDQAFSSTRLGVSQQVQSTLSAGTSSISDGIESFFNQVEQLTSDPSNSATQRTIVSAASTLAGQFNAAASGLDKLRNTLAGDIPQSVQQVNDLAGKIAKLNTQISGINSTGGQANDLMDQRDQLINQLSQQIDVKTVNQPNGVVNVLSSGAPIVIGQFASTFQAGTDATGNMVITQNQNGASIPVTFASGTLGAQLQEFNQDIPTTRSRLDKLASNFIQQVNQVQATGLGTAGPLASSNGAVTVADPSAPLASAGLPFPVQAGQLTIGLTDTTTGLRSNATIAIDPSSQSLQDVAAAITSGTGGKVQASVDPTTNTLKFLAQAGTKFDFAGRDTNPPSGASVANADTSGILPALGVNGLFTGSNAFGMKVSGSVSANPSLLATSVSGQPGDAANLERMAALRDQPSINGRTFTDEFIDQATSVGSDVQQLGDQQDTQNSLLQNLNAQQQSVIGVDTNEEMVKLLSAQQMIQSASQYMSVVNTAMQSLLTIIQ